MSRIGNKQIVIPAGVTVEVKDNFVTVKGPKGELKQQFNKELEIKVEDNSIKVSRKDDEIFSRQIHGTTRALLNNMVNGVNQGYSKKLEIVGVGYRAQVQGSKLVLALGFSHPVEVEIPEGLKVECPKNTEIVISGIDKEKLGKFASEIRLIKKPEPYKGKGIKYQGEHIRHKAGKTAK